MMFIEFTIIDKFDMRRMLSAMVFLVMMGMVVQAGVRSQFQSPDPVPGWRSVGSGLRRRPDVHLQLLQQRRHCGGIRDARGLV